MKPTAEDYIEACYAEDTQLQAVLARIDAAGMPQISVDPGYGRLLTLLVLMCQPKDVLEIGALGGYSGLCLARGLDAAGKLLSLELQPAYAQLAAETMRACGYGEQVQYRIGDAKASMRQLAEEGRRFDFFFIDAEKKGYPAYLELALALARPGALIVADNVLLHGRVADPLERAGHVQALREFNAAVAADPRLDSAILPAYDGLAIARVKAAGQLAD